MLLLLMMDTEGGDDNEGLIEPLRAALKAKPDGLGHASSKQAGLIIHCSLLRILALPEGHAGAGTALAAKVDALCAEWTARLSTAPPVELSSLLFVRERQIITLAGEAEHLPLGGAAAGAAAVGRDPAAAGANKRAKTE